MRPSSTPPDDDRPSQATSNNDSIDVAQSLREAEETLLRLKARYAQIQLDQQRQQELQHRLEDTRQGLRRDRTPALRAELKEIQRQLDEIEVALESQLFSWSGLKEIFWQAVRFGGLGVVMGWILRSCAGG